MLEHSHQLHSGLMSVADPVGAGGQPGGSAGGHRSSGWLIRTCPAEGSSHHSPSLSRFCQQGLLVFQTNGAPGTFVNLELLPGKMSDLQGDLGHGASDCRHPISFLLSASIRRGSWTERLISLSCSIYSGNWESYCGEACLAVAIVDKRKISDGFMGSSEGSGAPDSNLPSSFQAFSQASFIPNH